MKRNNYFIRESKLVLGVFSFQNLLKAYYQCRKNKRYTHNATKFETNFEKELLKLEFELKNHTYQPSRYICFAITDPKIREIWAADFRDRVVHHLLVNYIESTFEKKFIFHSYACRKNKGAHKAIKYLKQFICSLTKNSFQNVYPVKNNKISNGAYYSQMDIKNFFMTIEKNILYGLIKKHIFHPEILWLTKIIIFHNPTENYLIKDNLNLLNSVPKYKSLFYTSPNRGLPLGNVTSQFFANIYLNELDQFIKHKLKCRFYLRYMDDFILLNTSKLQLLDWQKQINFFVQNHLKLELNPKKQILQPLSAGINFLGYITKPEYLLSRRRVVSNLKRKLHYFNKEINQETNFSPEKGTNLRLPFLYSDNLPPLEFIQKAQATVNSYYGHFKHANCFKLRKSLYLGYFKELKNFLEPTDKNYSHFIIRKSYLNLLHPVK